MRVLCAVQHFRQGWGGAPESVRLMAALLADRDVSIDVFDLGHLRREVEALELLPEPGTPAELFELATVQEYDAIVVVGPWQNPRWLNPLLKARRPAQNLLYLPRGGLGRIEFSRPRDLKKWPYLFLQERRIIDASTAVVFSSKCEQLNTVAPARRRTREVIIPDLFQAAPQLPRTAQASAPHEIRFAFMAEISPRKALVPLMRAFRILATDPELTVPVRLVVGGSIRKGSEAYEQEARALAEGLPASAAVDFVGPVAHGARPEFYRDTDVFLVPSLFESYGLTVLEALAAGCATVCGPNLGVLEVLPPHPRLGIAAAVEPEALAVELKRQYRLALQQDEATRAATAAYCQQALSVMNARALDSWLELFAA
jgi:glycosyltransferase involved in cell wall biosynthesis